MSEINVFICSDGHRLAYNLWMPENRDVKAFVQILHGMAEHSARYERFAKYLNNKGIAVFAADHRGHGNTASDDELGWFAETDGWNRIAQDSIEMANFISTRYHAKKIILFGHSMGSFLARTVMVKHPDFYTGVVIMGTGCSKGLIGKLGKLIASLQVKKYGQKAGAVLMNKMSFGNYNRLIENAVTDFDWLSRDAKEVDKYIKDPKCGFLCSNGFFYDMLCGIEFANDKRNVEKLPKDLPILIVSGDKDPVGDYGKGVEKVYNLYKKAGIADLEMKLFEGARHELLNETNRKEVSDFIAAWILKQVQ